MTKAFATFLLLLSAFHFASAQNIPQQIDTILARSDLSGNSWTILIENESGTTRYYERTPTTGLAPASNTKMVTTAAAFALLGTNHFFESRVYRDGTFVNGTLTGNLNLVSEHDITWNTSVFGSGNARKALDFIAGKLKTNGLTQVIGNVQCYGVCYYGYGSTANVKGGTQATYNAEAATQFIAALQAQGITVSGSALGQGGFNPPGALFYTHKSTDLTYGGKPLRLDVACIPLNKVSHNPMADALLRHIGYKLSGTDTFAAGRARVFTWLQSIGISTNNTTMNDGSGLSSGNRFSAQQLVSLTRYMVPAYPSWDTTLPIGCVDGTIGSRFCGTAGSGRVHAKTGSLSSSIALSGYIDNPNESHRYFFSFIANRSSINQSATRQAIDDCVVLMGGRGVPISPEIFSVTNNGTGNALIINWFNEGFSRTGHRLYRSPDGVNFDNFVNLGANVFSYTDLGLPPGAKRFYRVAVLRSSGESLPSRTYGAQVGSGSAPLLLVDGNDRWRFHASRNPAATNHAFTATTAASISGPAFDTAHHDAVINGAIRLTNYQSVIWVLGEESTQDETFSATEQSLVMTYLNGGGNLFVSGAEIGWDLDRNSGPTTADRNFYRNYLRAALNGDANDDANTYSFGPVSNGIFTSNPSGVFDNGSVLYNVAFPDVLTPVNGSVAAMNYIGGRGGAAAVSYNGSLGGGKVVNMGFPFETITSASVRTAYMSDVLRFFGLVESPDFVLLQVNPPQNNLTLQWSASAGLTYRVQYKSDLTHPAWSTLSDLTATNTAASFTDTIAAGQKFYRVVLLH
ncbi:MAG: D-alanyl-D-alanine carboxypeptidase [Verrucomicrobia bacterium]|nr:D-alanyl-D-alanine carboxypeptidase [Verrucomicrobiota bacterium]